MKEPLLSEIVPDGFKYVLEEISNKIRAALDRAVRAVNSELIKVYREIGRIIYDKQQTTDWGSSVVERLAFDLRNLFPGVKGFSSRNLRIMRDLYISYRGF